MTRVYGVARDPVTNAPLPNRVVYAMLRPAIADLPAPTEPVVSSVVTDSSGHWELRLRQTVGTGAHYTIRVWLSDTYDVDVPLSSTPVLVDDIVVDLSEVPDVPPTWQLPPYVKLTEEGVPNGVATLGPDGILLAAQRPTVGNLDPQEWYAGDGPPPSVIQGAGVGDMYIDRLTGDLYQLN